MGIVRAGDAINEEVKSQQHHTIPRWLLENFADCDGMLYLAREEPRTFFKSKPRNVFRRRDYYAAKEVGQSLELGVLTRTENLCRPFVKNVLSAARKGIRGNDLSCVTSMQDDIQACGLFLLHLAYRSPQRLGDDFFRGFRAMEEALATAGKDLSLALREESTQLLQTGETVLVFSQVNAPQFIVGDCGPFISEDAELGVDNEAHTRNDPTWIPAKQRLWMALSVEVALGVAVREHDAKATASVLPDSELSANWVDHFNEICARHSRLVAGCSEASVREASRKAWPVDHRTSPDLRGGRISFETA